MKSEVPQAGMPSFWAINSKKNPKANLTPQSLEQQVYKKSTKPKPETLRRTHNRPYIVVKLTPNRPRPKKLEERLKSKSLPKLPKHAQGPLRTKFKTNIGGLRDIIIIHGFSI